MAVKIPELNENMSIRPPEGKPQTLDEKLVQQLKKKDKRQDGEELPSHLSEQRTLTEYLPLSMDVSFRNAQKAKETAERMHLSNLKEGIGRLDSLSQKKNAELGLKAIDNAVVSRKKIQEKQTVDSSISAALMKKRDFDALNQSVNNKLSRQAQEQSVLPTENANEINTDEHLALLRKQAVAEQNGQLINEQLKKQANEKQVMRSDGVSKSSENQVSILTQPVIMSPTDRTSEALFANELNSQAAVKTTAETYAQHVKNQAISEFSTEAAKQKGINFQFAVNNGEHSVNVQNRVLTPSDMEVGHRLAGFLAQGNNPNNLSMSDEYQQNEAFFHRNTEYDEESQRKEYQEHREEEEDNAQPKRQTEQDEEA